MRQLYYGDNLEIMREFIADESVDLVYLDPPFNSKRNYNVIFGTDAQIEAFKDSWNWNYQAEEEYQLLIKEAPSSVVSLIDSFNGFLGKNDMLAYIVMMTTRLLQLKRILKPNGSIYLHCDPTASHYLKIVMDSIWGDKNYLNEIIWQRTSSHNNAKRWGPVHDVILFYGKSEHYNWYDHKQEYSDEYIENYYKFQDDKGKFRLSDLTGKGASKGVSGLTWREIDPGKAKRHWAIPAIDSIPDWVKIPSDFKDWGTIEKLEFLNINNLIHFPKKSGGVPQYKRYLLPNKGVKVQDVITDIQPIQSHAREKLHYETQKPRALLERIIMASSQEGDVILDPFCGCGTAIDAAEKLGRSWIGIDITHLAINLIERRMRDTYPELQYEVLGIPRDLLSAQKLAERDKYQFQYWALNLIEARPPGIDKKKGSDGGIDGLIFFHQTTEKLGKVIVSVKGGKNIGLAMIKELISTVDNNGADMGIMLTLTPPTKNMLAEASKCGFYTHEFNGQTFPKIQILAIEDILNGQKPAMPSIRFTGGLNFKRAMRTDTTTQNTLKL